MNSLVLGAVYFSVARSKDFAFFAYVLRVHLARLRLR